jgi:hypothetical protein
MGSRGPQASSGAPKPLTPDQSRALNNANEHTTINQTIDGLLSRLEGNADFEAMAASRGVDASELVANLMTTWMSSSTSEMSTAMQLAARDAFHLHDAPLPPLTRSIGAFDPQKVYSEHAGALTAFLRAQYDATQAWFKNQGITSMPLHRGIGYGLLQHTPSGVKWNSAGTAPFDLRPMSSFSTSHVRAGNFTRSEHNIVISADVPVSRIISTPWTGMGAALEREMVVLGGPIQAQYISSSLGE